MTIVERLMRIETPFGEVQFRGHDRGRDVLLVITGAFADDDYFCLLQDHLPDVDVWRAHLPGNHCPELLSVGIGVFVAAFDAAIAQRARGRVVSVLGLSTGGLVALGLRSPEIRRLLVVEPPLRTGPAWPLRGFRDGQHPDWERFTWPIFGIDRTRHEDRSYLHLLDRLACPTRVVVGGVPLMPEREVSAMPSLVGDDVRAILAAHPLIEVTETPGAGHNIPRDAAHELLKMIKFTVGARAGEAAGETGAPRA